MSPSKLIDPLANVRDIDSREPSPEVGIKVAKLSPPYCSKQPYSAPDYSGDYADSRTLDDALSAGGPMGLQFRLLP